MRLEKFWFSFQPNVLDELWYFNLVDGVRVCDTNSRKITEVKHPCPQPVTGLVSRMLFTGSIPVLHTNLWFQKLLKLTSGSAVMTSWRRGVCQQLSQRKGACFLLNKKEAFQWIDPSEWWCRKEGWTSRESLWLPARGTWGYPIRAYRC